MKKIAIADDHALIREGIKAALAGTDNYNIVGEVSDGRACINLLKQEPIDVILLDIDMPKKNGVEVGQWIKSMQLNVKIIYITSHADFFSFYQAWRLRPSGFLFKENALEEILLCLQQVEQGATYFSPETEAFLNSNQHLVKNFEVIHDKLSALSAKEKQILLHIANSKTTREIADELFNSYKTIENHRYNISRKLDINGANNLMRFAIQHYDLIKAKVSDDILDL